MHPAYYRVWRRLRERDRLQRTRLAAWRRGLPDADGGQDADRAPPFRTYDYGMPDFEPLPAQIPPEPGDWRKWLFMGGRAAGKTRAGAEWVRMGVTLRGMKRIALVAPTLHDARAVMTEGASGLLSLDWPRNMRPLYQPSLRRIVWPNGAEAALFGAEDPDGLRGPQFDHAWCDEAAAWTKGEAAHAMLDMGLRLSAFPQALFTTTPKPVPLVKTLLAAAARGERGEGHRGHEGGAEVRVTRAATRSNTHLPPSFGAAMQRRYGGSALGRQELEAELIESHRGALWPFEAVQAARTRPAPPPHLLGAPVVAVDPPAGKGKRADACGIIAAARVRVRARPEAEAGAEEAEAEAEAGAGAEAGRGQLQLLFQPQPQSQPRLHVLADATVQGLAPLGWARRAARLAAELGASCVVAEANQGGEMVRTVLQTAGCAVPVRLVHARRSKTARAEPLAALYAAGRVSHAPGLDALERALTAFGTPAQRGSPDRVDALVWAGAALTPNAVPRLREV